MPPRTLIICKSVHHGNTLRVARVMAEILHADLASPEDMTPDCVSGYDAVGVGSGIYFGRFHADLRRWIERAPSAAHRPTFILSTAGLSCLWRLWHWPLRTQLSRKGFHVVAEFHCRGFDTVGPLWLIGGLNRRHPDERDLELAAEFARGVLRNLSAEGVSRSTQNIY